MNQRTRRGVILIAALLVLTLLTLLVTAFVQNEHVEMRLARRQWDTAVARHAAWSGIHRAMADLASDADPFDGRFEAWQGLDAAAYEALEVGEDAFVSLVRAHPEPSEAYDQLYYGIEDENGKIDINTASPAVLEALPGMTPELAAAIVDWRDGDDDPTDGGAESEYYLALTPPYRPKNAPFESLEELLLVRGFTTALLYGEDRNRNGLLDPNENDGDERPPTDDADSVLNRGLAPYLTCWSRVPNTAADGRPRVNANTADATQLREGTGEVLTPAEAQAIVQARTLRGGQFQTLGDVLDAQGLSIEKYQQIVDRLTLADDAEVAGLINVNTAPRAVLAAIVPGTNADEVAALVDAIMAARVDPEPARGGIGWLLEIPELREDSTGLPFARFRALSALVTTRSEQFRVQAVGWARGRTAFARWDAVVDRRSGAAKIVWIRDATRLGLPEPLPLTEEEERLP